MNRTRSTSGNWKAVELSELRSATLPQLVEALLRNRMSEKSTVSTPSDRFTARTASAVSAEKNEPAPADSSSPVGPASSSPNASSSASAPSGPVRSNASTAAQSSPSTEKYTSTAWPPAAVVVVGASVVVGARVVVGADVVEVGSDDEVVDSPLSSPHAARVSAKTMVRAVRVRMLISRTYTTLVPRTESRVT